MPTLPNALTLIDKSDHLSGRFSAMASPCEILIDSNDTELAKQISIVSYEETKRIEHKYSRYLPDNLMSAINQSNNQTVSIDLETYRLLDFANTCFEISDGMFDITSGVLRRAWKFDGSDHLPEAQEVEPLRQLIGWQQVKYEQNSIRLPVGFELDFGGIGKEYAVDSVAKLCNQIAPDVSILVNFGGDIQVTRPRKQNAFWQVGIEDPSNPHNGSAIVKIARGGLATSGDANRYLLKDGIRYGHVLNPKTGYPIVGAPRSVTVAAEQCVQSGLLATLALLMGNQAETFLTQQNVTHWCFW